MNLQQHITQLELAIAEVELADEIVTELTEQLQKGRRLYEDCQIMEVEDLLHLVGLRIRAVTEGINI